MTTTVGLIGFGSIGREVAETIRDGRAGDTELVAVLVRDAARVQRVAPSGVTVTDDRNTFLAAPWTLAVEAAGQPALREHGAAVLGAGRSLMAVSVGALADDALLGELRRLATEAGVRLLIPSGAIAGLDAIGAAALAPLDEVRHTVRKPPAAFSTEQLGGEPVHEARILFDGSAAEGARRFPENVNVAAAVGLAGIGIAATRLRVIADPTLERNRHEVEVRGYFGRLRIEMENIPGTNPKTGRITALSIAKALRELSAPMVVGS